MIAKLLQVIGVVVLLAAAGVAVAGFLFCKDRIRVVVQADSQDGKPDAAALLHDDVAQLTAAQAAMAQAVADNFGRLQQANESAAVQRQQELMAALHRLSGLADATTALAQATAALTTRLAAVEAALREGSAHAAAAELAGAAKPAPMAIAPPLAEPVAAAPQPEVQPPTVPAPAPAPTTGFLSFQLPSTQFHFDRLQDYEFVPELSRVGFDAKSTLHDFSGVTSSLRGHFAANLADPSGGWTGEVTCQVATLTTGVAGRDDNLRNDMDSAHHPDIRFELTGFEPAKDGIDAAKMEVHGTAHGKMTIRGKTQAIDLQVKVSVDASRRVLVEADAPLKMSDYGVVVPTELGMLTVQDEVKIWLSLRGRAKVGK